MAESPVVAWFFRVCDPLDQQDAFVHFDVLMFQSQQVGDRHGYGMAMA